MSDRTTALERTRLGPLATVIDRVLADMRTRGYAPKTIHEYTACFERLGLWMAQHRCGISTLDESTVHGLLEELAGSARKRARAAMRRLLATLRGSGIVVDVASAPSTPLQDVVRRFLAVYQRTRGVLSSTCRQYGFHVRQFLAFRFPSSNDVPDLTTIVAQDVQTFIASRAAQGHTEAAKTATAALRAFLRYLVQEGHCRPDLITAVPTVARRRNPVPRHLTDTQVATLMAAFDRGTAIGRRDYAIALCLWQLALRVGEVVLLRLDDVDWRAGTVHIRTSKARRATRLPLPREVGQAIAEYVRDGRPTTTDRHLFVTHALPMGRPLASCAARQTIRRAFQRARLAVPSTGTHTLRHTAATSMTCRGASLKEVADVLRHRNLDTTMIYARVDLPTLRSVALPWPEVQ